MKLVLDASVAAKWVLPEADNAKAVSLRDDYNRGVHELISPDILFLEVAHALTRAERRGVIKPPEALVKLADVLSTAPYFYPFGPFLTRAAALSSQTRVGVYDCLYVVLAQQEQCAVVTADLRLKTVFRAQVILLADLP